MSELECRTCGSKWNGCYNMDGRCVTCGEQVKAKEPWRECHADDRKPNINEMERVEGSELRSPTLVEAAEERS